MSFFQKLINNLSPYYFIKKHQISSESDPLSPGGFYSPIPSLDAINKHNFNAPLPELIPGIDLNADEQLVLLDSFEPFYKELPFPTQKIEGFRYYYENEAYGYSDAIMLYSMIRHLKPKKLIEVGSGFSSSVTLDTNEKFMNGSINCVFIEPYPKRLESLLKDHDKEKITIHKKGLQEVPLEVFKELKENDILFIDSTHISKFNSDVNYLFNEILPALASGVYIHIHDIFYPFEYPQEYLLEGRAWNEQYTLKAFLQYNKAFKIVLFNTYLQSIHEDKVKHRFPLLYKNTGGSIWLKKM
ncbi:class I SAM-dependent methyltransferase [Chryseobacterium schmidteae]|uniref:class I SAM-dependent methyltransferase n=1 Tax=Chryseobacterium schmidteae TaxID=2730404 RepID=UPI00158A67A8|nr:class I SAM-dependent methyltransferase [Chryseobacterium schmidteae]